MAGRDIYKHATPISSSAGVTGDQTVHGFAIYNGNEGSTASIGVQTYAGEDVQFKNVPSGAIIPVHHKKVYGLTAAAALRTTAFDIISLS